MVVQCFRPWHSCCTGHLRGIKLPFMPLKHKVQGQLGVPRKKTMQNCAKKMELGGEVTGTCVCIWLTRREPTCKLGRSSGCPAMCLGAPGPGGWQTSGPCSRRTTSGDTDSAGTARPRARHTASAASPWLLLACTQCMAPAPRRKTGGIGPCR